MKYRSEMIDRFWRHQQGRLADREVLFDRKEPTPSRPPVFLPEHADNNVVLNPSATQPEREQVLAVVPRNERHRWFPSMSSSQALAQSVFGNLAVAGKLELLCDVMHEDGEPLVPLSVLGAFRMEHAVTHLGEPRSTSLDVFFDGPVKIAFECKLTEEEVGTCSRPRKKPDDPQHCDGTLPLNRLRGGLSVARCALPPEVAYWQYVPTIFSWLIDADMEACPLNTNYQLVRNVLAVTVDPARGAVPGLGRAVLVYDERNPAFQAGGLGFRAFESTRAALRPQYASALTKCSWQRIMVRLRDEPSLGWLAAELAEKYGL